MKRLLLALLSATLLPLGLSAAEIDPKLNYRVVLAHDKPEGWHPDNWRLFVQSMSGTSKSTRVDGNSIFYTFDKMLGKHLLERLDPNDIGNKFVPYRLVSADPLPADGNPSKPAEEKPKTPAAPPAPQGNGPLSEEDRKGKPVHYAGSAEAQAQARESAARQDKAVAKFKQSGASGNGPVSGEGLLGKDVHYAGSPEALAQAQQSALEQDKAVAEFKKSGAPGNGPISGEGLLGKDVKNTGAFVEDDGLAAPAAPAPTPAPSRGGTFSQRQQGTKKEDTLFKNQNQNNPAPAPAAGRAPVTGGDRPGKPAPNSGRAAEEEEEAAAARDEFETPNTGISPRKQGTKKDDTLFKNQNQGGASPAQPASSQPASSTGKFSKPKDPGK